MAHQRKVQLSMAPNIVSNEQTSNQPPIHLTIYPVLDSTDVVYVLESQSEFSVSLFDASGRVLRPLKVEDDGMTHSCTVQAPCDVYVCAGRSGLVFSLNGMSIPAHLEKAVARC